ncbi:MAG: CDP-alcohol phosphatidyltransferase [Planctomycetes bacterium]|nr:CDP-alcohol phosphatidyltransferase [Planctomycetota bacterium]
MSLIQALQAPDPRSRVRFRRLRPFLAWCVHLYTALGLVAAAGMAVLIAQPHPTPESFRLAFALMLVATVIDATDGTLARLVKVKEVLPGFDGRRLDDLIDFLTYTFLPLLLVWRAGILPPGYEPWLLLPLLASAYGFSQVEAKTADGYFLGFPSYWNLVAFYLYVLRPPGWLSVTLLAGFALLTFVPARYLYPTQRGKLNQLTNLLGTFWAVLLVWILWNLPVGSGLEDARILGVISLAFPAYYLGASWAISLKYWWKRRRAQSRKPQPASGTP